MTNKIVLKRGVSVIGGKAVSTRPVRGTPAAENINSEMKRMTAMCKRTLNGSSLKVSARFDLGVQKSKDYNSLQDYTTEQLEDRETAH